MKGDFTAKEDMDMIELRLDPENDVIESDDQFMEGSYGDANIIRSPLSVEDEVDRTTPVVVLISISIMVLFVLILFSLFLYRSKVHYRSE